MSFLQRMLDDKVLCTVHKPFEWRTIEGLTKLSTTTMSEFLSVKDHQLQPRQPVKGHAAAHARQEALNVLFHGHRPPHMLAFF